MSLNMQVARLYGVTQDQLQTIYDNALREHRSRVFFLDASYMYNFHLDDFDTVRKFNILGRYYSLHLRELEYKIVLGQKINPIEYEQALEDNSKYCNEWHKCLERWYQDQTVTIADRTFKPIKIVRTLDRVVNEGMVQIANAICGLGTVSIFDWRVIGDGDIDSPSLADTTLSNEVDRINVNETPEGGSLSRDGTTIYSVGNHSKETETPNNGEFTECGIVSESSTTNDKMLDHSVFDDPIQHIQNVDSPGSTTVIYMCSG